MGWWDEGEGTETVHRLHFHLRKIGRIYIKIHLYSYTPPDYLCDFNSIRSRERKPYLLQNPGWEIPVTFLARRHIQIKT